MNYLSYNIPFINTSWVVAHNSFANTEDGWKYVQQKFNLNTLFEKGIRGFMIDIHYHDNKISICHEREPQRDPSGVCFDTRFEKLTLSAPTTLEAFLTSLYDIIVKNSDEIIILFLECYVPMEEVKSLFVKNNLIQFQLTTNPNNPELTVGDIISKKTPLIVFSDYSNKNNKRPIDGFFQTKYLKESKYNLAEYQGCEDRNEWSRSKYNEKEFGGQKINLFLLNHFYQTSFNFKFSGMTPYYEINDYNSIKERSVKCQKEFSLFPNFIAVDYVEEGNWGGVFRHVNELNYKTLCALTNNDCTSVNQVGYESKSYHEKEELAVDHQDNKSSTVFEIAGTVMIIGLTYCIGRVFHPPFIIDSPYIVDF